MGDDLKAPVEIRVWSGKEQVEHRHRVALGDLQGFLEDYPESALLMLSWDKTKGCIDIAIEEKPSDTPNMWQTEIYDDFYFIDFVPSKFFVPLVQKLRSGFQTEDKESEVYDFIDALYEESGTKPLWKRIPEEEWEAEVAAWQEEMEARWRLLMGLEQSPE